MNMLKVVLLNLARSISFRDAEHAILIIHGGWLGGWQVCMYMYVSRRSED